METYANVLLIALPSFMVLILIEIIYGVWKKELNYNLMDTISSLSASWWSYRANSRANNKGWRIDYNMVSLPLKDAISRAFILPEMAL